MRHDVLKYVLTIAVLLTGGSAAAAQDTRAEAQRRQREEKSQNLTPYKPSGLEKALTVAEDRAFALTGREGLYPRIGSLTTGSGFTLGAGYRNSPMFKRYGTLDVWGARSFAGYWAVEARATFPELANGHLFAETWATRREYPNEDFFGIGTNSLRIAQVNFALNRTIYGANAAVRPIRPLRIGGGFQSLRPEVGPGSDPNVPSIETRFSDRGAPGLSEQPLYWVSSFLGEFDYRQPINARRGGWYRFRLDHYDDREFNAYSFDRFDVDLRQFVPFLAERRVLAARAFLSTSNVEAGQTMPFYLMPYLGGNDTLRGFREYRFRGPHSMLFQGEYRYEIWSGLEGALFYDTGKVTLDRSDLNFKDLHRDYGFGFRANTDTGVIIRVDAGFGSIDGKHLYITFGGVF
jgi:surface antigen Omp85-like protein